VYLITEKGNTSRFLKEIPDKYKAVCVGKTVEKQTFVLCSKCNMQVENGFKFFNSMMRYEAWFNNFELELLFDNENSVRVHVHPYVKVFKDFLKICIKNGFMSVHFYNKNTTNLVSLHRDISDEEEMAWFVRSLETSKDVFNTSKFDDFFRKWQMEKMSESAKKRTHYFMFDRKVKSVIHKYKKR
jgi:hypothetical protein